jgi:hypothetical protein
MSSLEFPTPRETSDENKLKVTQRIGRFARMATNVVISGYKDQGPFTLDQKKHRIPTDGDLRTSEEGMAAVTAALHAKEQLNSPFDLRETSESLATDAANGYVSWNNREHPGLDKFAQHIKTVGYGSAGIVLAVAGFIQHDWTLTGSGVGIAALGFGASMSINHSANEARQRHEELNEQAQSGLS